MRLSRGRVLTLALIALLAVAGYIVAPDLIRGYWTTRGEIHAQLHVWPGGHDSSYWHSHLHRYLEFYAGHCA
jgi:hypothetical protein